MTNFFNLIHQSLKTHTQKKLIVWTKDATTLVFTGNELLQKIADYRCELEKLSLESGQKVIPAIATSVDTLCALLAIQSLGMVPVSPPTNLHFFSFIIFLKKHKIKALVFNKKQNKLVVLLFKFLSIKIALQKETNTLFNFKATEVPTNQAALISFSSGSTGKPKAIYRSHDVLSNQHLAIKNTFVPFNGQIDFPLFPNILLHNLIVGVKSVLPDIKNQKAENINPQLICKQIRDYSINSMTGNVFYFSKLVEELKDKPQFFPQIKAIGIGGSPVHEHLIQAVKHFFNAADFYVIYGSSEAEPIAVRKVGDDFQNPLNGFYVGKIIDEIELRIIGNQKIETPKGFFNTGEIEVKGKHVVGASNEWLKTGDFGYLTTNNDLYLTGRKGNEKANFNLQHYQIEHLLLQQSEVKKAAAISNVKGFILYLEGDINVEDIWKIINLNLPKGSIKSIHLNIKIPVDLRHQSKIIYEKLK